METSNTGLVEIVIPVYNEEAQLATSVERLRHYLSTSLPYKWRITIADNASTDNTWTVADALAHTYTDVRAVYLPLKGRGRALQHTWLTSDADVVAYMDVDLSTGLEHFLPLVAPLMRRESDIAIGTRLSPTSQVTRGIKREVISRSYNFLIKMMFWQRFSDAQCGFKAMRTSIARQLLPLVKDRAWFWDTEMLLLAEHNGLRIHEVAVRWVDDPDSRVRLGPTIWADLKGLTRMRSLFWQGGGTITAREPAKRVMPQH